MDRAIENYRSKRYFEEWIEQRVQTIDVPRELTEQYDHICISALVNNEN